MSGFGSVGHGFSLKALLEDPNLQNPPNLNSGLASLKKTSKHGGFMPNANSAFLGPNLWEKPSSGSEDFDLEYMDLDEFLSENGVPVDPNEIDDAQTISLLANALSSSPSRSPNDRDSPIMIGPLSPKLEDHLDMMMKETSMASPSNYYMPITPPSVHQNSISSPTPSEPSAIEQCLMESTFELKVASSEPGKPTMAPTSVKRKIAEADFQMKSQEIAMVTIPVYRQNSPQIMSSSISPSPSPVWESSQHSDDCTSTLTHNTVPGQENFDPKSRKFSEEELKPQPIIKKSKKIFVDDQSKDEKYWNRRSKNNVAAKRSRDARRVKENQIAMRAAFLEQEYENMKQELKKTLLENKDLIRRLSKYENV